MTEQQCKLICKMTRAEFELMFGPPPVWSTESVEGYYKMLDNFMTCLRADDYVEQNNVREVTTETWEINRWKRFQRLTVEGNFRKRKEYQAKTAKEVNDRREAMQRSLAENGANGAAGGKHALDLVNFIEETPTDIDAIFRRTANELEHARAFEEGLEVIERLDELVDAAIRRRNDALEQLERYREGLGHKVRRLSDQLIDAEFTEVDTPVQVEAPSIVAGGA